MGIDSSVKCKLGMLYYGYYYQLNTFDKVPNFPKYLIMEVYNDEESDYDEEKNNPNYITSHMIQTGINTTKLWNGTHIQF